MCVRMATTQNRLDHSSVERVRVQTTDADLLKLLRDNTLGHKDATLRADMAKLRLLCRAATHSRTTVARIMLNPMNRIATVAQALREHYSPLEFKQMLEAILSLIKNGALKDIPEPHRSQYISAWRIHYRHARRAYGEAPRAEPTELPDQNHVITVIHDALSKLAPGHKSRLMVKILLHIGDVPAKLLAQLPGCVVQTTEDPDADSQRPKA